MSFQAPTSQAIEETFRSAFMSIPNAREVATLADFSALFGSVLNPSWTRSRLGVEYLNVSESIVLFRVVTTATLEEHGDGHLARANHQFTQLADAVRAIIPSASVVSLFFHRVATQEEPLGLRFTLRVQGVIERNPDPAEGRDDDISNHPCLTM